jgi:signal transduction histidine kinase/CheY-like chemotaxis protein/HPt (histidine-containing phosphotransfer) domain-containing protein
MKVKTRVISGLFVSIGVLCLGLVGLVQTVVVDSFKKIELERFERNVGRVQNALTTQLEILLKSVVDWGQWDNTYQFMSDRNQAYIDETLNFMTLAALGFRDVLYFDNANELIQSAHIVNTERTVEPTPSDVVALLKQMVAAERAKGIKEGSGLIQINGETTLYAFTEILPSKRDAAGRGTILASTLVTDAVFKSWAYQTNLPLRFWRFSQETPSSEASLALHQLEKGVPFVLRQSAGGGSAIFGLIRDVAGQPALLFEFEDDAIVTQLAERVRNGAVIGVATAGLLALILLWWLIDRQLLGRLSTLSSTVQQITVTGYSDLRLTDSTAYRRSLQTRVLATVASCFLLMGGALWAFFEHTLTDAFEEVERKNISDNVIRAERALNGRAQELLGKTADWGQWDATYEFAEKRNNDYIEANLNYETLSALGMKAVAFFSPQGTLLYGREVAPQSAATFDLTPQLADILFAGIGSVRRGKSTSLEAGLLRGPEGLLMVTRSPILDSDRSKPSRGSFVFVLPVDQRLIDELSRQTKLSIAVYPNDSSRASPPNLEVVDPENIIGRAALTGIDGHQVGMVQILLRRYVHLEGLAARRNLLLALVLLSFLGTLLAAVIVHRVIISALAASVAQMSDITRTRDTSRRLTTTGDDELGLLTEQINSMLDSLARAHSDLQVARDGAEAANRAKSTFIAKVSHELRTPIHGIVGMLRILMKEETSKTKRAYIAMAKNSAFGLLDTINEILDFSKMETGNLSLEHIEFRLRDVVRDALRTVAPRAEDKGAVELVYDILPGVPDLLRGDPLRIKQCLINLLGNAIKFTQQGYVKLTVSCAGSIGEERRIVAAVTDTGVGIPADRLPKIFDPFTQADDSVARVFSGTGLGLTIVKQLAEEMNGSIEVESTVGIGTTFTLSLSVPALPDSTWHEPELVATPRKMLIIDGDSHAVKLMDSSAGRYGLESSVINSRDPLALASVRAHLAEYGVCIVTADAIRRSHVFNLMVDLAREKRIPVVVVVPSHDISLRERLNAAGISLVLMRPISFEDIVLGISGRLPPDEGAWSNNDAPLHGGRSLRILVADDTETNRIILSSMLSEAGHEVTCVENGLDLLAAIKRQFDGSAPNPDFDIVLTDVQMPIMDGLTATREIRALEAASGRATRIPVIAVTAHAMNEEIDRMRGGGVDDIVTKPIHPNELARVLTVYGGGSAEASPIPVAEVELPEQAQTPVTPELHELQTEALEVWERMCADESLDAFGGVDARLPFAQILDLADVYLRSGQSVRRTKLILAAFGPSFEDPITSLGRAKAANDIDGLKYAAHTLKGLLLDVGAVTSAQIASTIEAHCKAGRFAQGAEGVEMLTDQVLTIARLLSACSTRLASHGLAHQVSQA